MLEALRRYPRVLVRERRSRRAKAIVSVEEGFLASKSHPTGVAPIWLVINASPFAFFAGVSPTDVEGSAALVVDPGNYGA